MKMRSCRNGRKAPVPFRCLLKLLIEGHCPEKCLKYERHHHGKRKTLKRKKEIPSIEREIKRIFSEFKR